MSDMEDDDQDIFYSDEMSVKNNVKSKTDKVKRKKPNNWTCTPIMKLHDDERPTFGIKLQRNLEKRTKTKRNKKFHDQRLKDSKALVQSIQQSHNGLPAVVTFISFNSREDLDRQLRKLIKWP